MIIKLDKYDEIDEKIKESLDLLNIVVKKEIILERIRHGEIVPYVVTIDDVICGFVFTRVDECYDQQKELVIMFSVSMKPGINLTRYLGGIYERIANGMRIRVHSERRGADTLLEKDGYKFIETVWSKG